MSLPSCSRPGSANSHSPTPPNWAERPDPKNRSFQSGQAWRGFQKFWGKATDAEFPRIFSDLMEFAQCDDPLASMFPLSPREASGEGRGALVLN